MGPKFLTQDSDRSFDDFGIIEYTIGNMKIIMDKILVTVTMTPNSVVGVHGGSPFVVFYILQ